MKKILIRNHSTLTDLLVLKYVSKVVEMGKISNNNTQYCYVTTFKNPNIIVEVTISKTKTNIFHIYNIL